MAAPAASIDHGGTALLLVEGPKIRRLRNGLDSVDALYHSATLEEFLPGSAFPGFANVNIDEHEADPDGTDFFHRITGRGIAGTKSSRRISRRKSANLEGFDSAFEEWITTDRNYIRTGDRMSGETNMVCEMAEPEDLDDTAFYIVRAQYRGLLSGATKPVKRTITSNGRVISLESLINPLTGGWSTAKQSEILWPNVQVTFQYWGTTVPTKNLPEQGGTPPGELYPVVNVEGTASGGNDAVTYHWPNGWRCISFSSDCINGTTICQTTEVWEYQQRITF